ncbi:MAG: selenide, water dikinase SelD [Bacteroidia bacterium]|jgi:selenide,water dikinase|nr:selenide, water dikinase SelD [Bacteroidia bacterium]
MIKLTQYAKGSGCGCKIEPAVLQKLLHDSRTSGLDNLLIGNQNNDDASVYLLADEQCLIVTADFFTPVVDDPFLFGKIASANALSDVYAMGGNPITAIAIMGWPIDKIPVEVAATVMAGAKETCHHAGVVISGGHTIDAPEPFFGLSVNGLAKKQEIKLNSSAVAGDFIYITKPIGFGIIGAAIKKGLQLEHIHAFYDEITSLNKIGAVLGKQIEINAMTDITGYGLGGHLLEVCKASNVGAKISLSAIPVLSEIKQLAAQGVLPDATYRNWNNINDAVTIDEGVDALLSFALLADPQTNGGLLFTINPTHDHIVKQLFSMSRHQVYKIGVISDRASAISVIV